MNYCDGQIRASEPIQNEELNFPVQNLSKFFSFIASPASHIGLDLRLKEDDVYCYDTLPQAFPYKLSASKLSLINFDQSGIISLHVELNIVSLCRHLEHMNIQNCRKIL